MTTPRTIAGQAAFSALCPHVQRAFAQTIVSIVRQAEMARRPAGPLLAPEPAEEPSPPGHG